MQAKTRIVGLLAHVDAGKTTLSEAMLFASGSLRKLGRVDHQNAFLDSDIQERERGITIFSKQAILQWRGEQLTLLDTPGHVDFSSEMERTLPVLDCAVLLISGTDGVQSHTETLWHLLRAYNVPTLLFMNKMDQPGTDRGVLMHALKTRLSEHCIDFSAPGKNDEIALCSEAALERYLETGDIPQDEVASLVQRRSLFPCFFGSALKLRGVEPLLDALLTCLPPKTYGDSFGARVYKVAYDPQGVRLTYLKVTGGFLRPRDTLINAEREEKVHQLRLYSGAKYRDLDIAEAGTVCAVTGLTGLKPGDGLGISAQTSAPLLTPVFTYQVLPPVGYDPHSALEILRRLEEEDPQLHVMWNGALREISVQLMGEVQLEILRRILLDRFSLPVAFGEGSILYRETIADTVEGVGHYEPLRHYAEVQLHLEPAERGSGVQITAACPEDQLARNWQRLILTHLMEKQHLGVLTGAPLTDIKITLTAGRAHLKHTEGGDFRQAVYRAVRQGLMQAQSILLEPWYDMRLTVPRDCVGRAMNDIQQMGGSFTGPELTEDTAFLAAAVPVAAAQHYARTVVAYTRGRGQVACSLRGYAPCSNQREVVAQCGYDPERDVDNTPDSVFCAHGAGYVVKWDRAAASMHLPSSLRPAPISNTTAAPPVRSVSSADDAHLRRIFERTYGPIRERTAPPPRRDCPTVNNRPILPASPQVEYLLVDGYNMVFAWPELKGLAAHSLEHARGCLIDILANYHGFRPCELIVVFDAYKIAGNPGAQEEYNGIHIVYTREAETADSYIEKTIYHIARDHRVRVATSDGMEQLIILGSGALRVSANEFRKEIEETNVEIDAILARSRSDRACVTRVEKAMQAALRERSKNSCPDSDITFQ